MDKDAVGDQKGLALPQILSKDEIKSIFYSVNNQKHLLILKLCYGMGLRINEVIGLKISHINSKGMRVLIIDDKGRNEYRYVALPNSVLNLLRDYYRVYKPQKWLFEESNGKQYSIKRVHTIFKNALLKTGIKKKIGVNALRYSYIKHLLGSGVHLSFIQNQMGNGSMSTEQFYRNSIQNIKTPLDEL